MPSTLTNPQIAIVKLPGHINASNALELQNQIITAITSKSHSMVLIDMEKVDDIDKIGLMALFCAFRIAHHLECRFALYSVAPSIRLIFDQTELNWAFDILESNAAFEAEAKNHEQLSFC